VSVLVAIAPQMYREAVVNTLKSRRPDVEVEACPPEDLDQKLALFLQPELLLCHDTAPQARERIHSRVEINYSDSLDATIFRDGQSTRIADISLERLLTFLDQIAVLE
jgi:hypothetical protein